MKPDLPGHIRGPPHRGSSGWRCCFFGEPNPLQGDTQEGCEVDEWRQLVANPEMWPRFPHEGVSSGFIPLLALEFTLPLRDARVSTQSTCPFKAAQCMGVSPVVKGRNGAVEKGESFTRGWWHFCPPEAEKHIAKSPTSHRTGKRWKYFNNHRCNYIHGVD